MIIFNDNLLPLSLWGPWKGSLRRSEILKLFVFQGDGEPSLQVWGEEESGAWAMPEYLPQHNHRIKGELSLTLTTEHLSRGHSIPTWRKPYRYRRVWALLSHSLLVHHTLPLKKEMSCGFPGRLQGCCPMNSPGLLMGFLCCECFQWVIERKWS